MYYPAKEEFLKIAREGNVIPVYKEMVADFDTPLSAFRKIDEGKFSYLLESVEKGEHIGRYSFLGTDPALVFESKGKEIKITRGDDVETFTTEEDPISEIKKILEKFTFVAVKGLPRFCGGLLGYIGYDMVRFFEDLPDSNPDEFNFPDTQLVLTDAILILDHVDHKIKVVSNVIVMDDPAEAYDRGCKKVDYLLNRLKNIEIKQDEINGKVMNSEEVGSNFTKEEFSKCVETAKEYIRSGDIIQVVLSQRFQRKTEADAFMVYRALRSINPSPYMYYLKFGGNRIVGSSPEILVRCEDDVVEVRPIAGTRKRGTTEEEDRRMEEELLSDPKERAEHIMLVDLGRNDIGRVCEYSTVEPRSTMEIEKYSHVMHIVSDVTGKLREDKDVYDVIRATFPAGTVTGAPKVRAMEIIDELEKTRRGPYAGSVGYLSFSGNIDLCITIRTIVMREGIAYIQAGAGIVLDSDPALEYKETMNKAMAMIKAIEFVEKGFE